MRDDQLNAARGVVIAFGIGLLLWAAIAIAWVLAR